MHRLAANVLDEQTLLNDLLLHPLLILQTPITVALYKIASGNDKALMLLQHLILAAKDELMECTQFLIARANDEE